jgi:hypothetical protein
MCKWGFPNSSRHTVIHLHLDYQYGNKNRKLKYGRFNRSDRTIFMRTCFQKEFIRILLHYGSVYVKVYHVLYPIYCDVHAVGLMSQQRDYCFPCSLFRGRYLVTATQQCQGGVFYGVRSQAINQELKCILNWGWAPSGAKVGTGNGTPEVPELPSAWGYSWATLSPGVINMER